jgi:hypothetical protein
MLTQQQQLDQFLQNTQHNVTVAQLDLYVRSRGLERHGNKAAKILAVVDCMKEEVERKGWIIVDTYDGEFDNRRLAKLIALGVLTFANAPGLVPPPTPPTGAAWRFVEKEDIPAVDMLQLVYDWCDMFYKSGAESHEHLRKANSKATSRKTYYVQTTQVDDFLYFKSLCDASQKTDTKKVVVVFRVPVGRDSNQAVSIVAARCGENCIVGLHHPACNHALANLLVLQKIQIGIIQPGDVGDGERAWGSPSSDSKVPVQPIMNISLLTGGAKLAAFTGLRPECPPGLLGTRNAAFVRNHSKRAGPHISKVCLEVHAGVEISRHGPPAEPRRIPFFSSRLTRRWQVFHGGNHYCYFYFNCTPLL